MMNQPPQMPPPDAEQPQMSTQQLELPLTQEDQIEQTPKIPARLRQFIESDNIAKLLDDKKLLNIGHEVVRDTELDDDSRQEWKDQLDKALDIAKQILVAKSYPWPDAANVKLPLILTGCVQFNARTFPQLMQNDKVVKIESLKSKPTEMDVEKAKDLSAHMSYQLMHDSSNWIDDKDKMLMVLPLLGTVFTKTYYDPISRRPQVDLCLPDEIIINQKAKSIEKTQRITHAYWLTNNRIITYQRKGLFLDVPLKELTAAQEGEGTREDGNISEDLEKPGEKIEDEKLEGGMTLHKFYEQVNYLDLDEDGYAEPYITTVHVATKKVMRIVAKYNYESFIFDDKKKNWIEITPERLYTVYKFLPSFDGTFYGMGFSQMLYPMNAAANSVLNRLLDAGTLSNLQSGFIGKGLRMRKKTMRLRPGEWTTVSTAAGINLSQNIVPIPTKEPSSVLFELLGMLVKSAQEISGVSDVMQGQLPPANTPATTVVNLISEGTKVFSSITIRLDNSMAKEFLKLYKLNKTYLSEIESFKTAARSGQVSVDDYQSDDYAIRPVANPAMGTEAKQLAIMQALMSVKDDPILNKQEILKRFFDALNIPDNDKLFAPPPPPDAPPPPEVQKIMKEIEFMAAKIGDIYARLELDSLKLDLDEKELLIKAEDVAGNKAAQKIDSMAVVAGVEQTENKDKVEAAAKMAEAIGATPPIDIQDLEQKTQQFEEKTGEKAGIIPPPQQPPQQPPEQPPEQSPPGTPSPGGDQGLQQSLADKMEQAAPQPEQPQGGERLPMGEEQ